MKQKRSGLALEEQEYLRAKDRKYHQVRNKTDSYLTYKQNYYQDNKQKLGLCVKKSAIKRKYGIDWEQFMQMYEDQEGLCAICKKEPTKDQMLSIDHSHQTGKVRGLLCGPCNRALGLFKDNPETLQTAKEYVS